MSHFSQRSRSPRSLRPRYVPRIEDLEQRSSPTLLLRADIGLGELALLASEGTDRLAPSAATEAANPIEDSPAGADSREEVFPVLPGQVKESLGTCESSFPAEPNAFARADWDFTAGSALRTDPFEAEPWATAHRPRPLPHYAGTSVMDAVGGAGTFLPAGSPGVAPAPAAHFAAPKDNPAADLLWLSSAILSAAGPALAVSDSGGESGPGGLTPPLYGGFEEVVLLRDANLGQATGMAWAPDGTHRLFILRKGGQVRIVQYGQLLPTPFATITPIYTASECGLIGIAFDPNYIVNRYVYFFVTVSNSEQQIIRYTDADNIGTDKTTILGGLPTRGANHDGGAIGFGPDGKLYFAVGDLGNGTGVNENLTTLAAKVGRANPDGSVPGDNPFDDGDGPNNDYIYAIGFRNPYTFTFQPTTGELWVNVVGTSYEQVFSVPPGGHGGWNRYENNQPEGFLQPLIKYRTNGFDVRNLTANGAVRNNGVATFTTTAVHGFRRGEYITIAGVTNDSFDGLFAVLDVPSPTTFRVAQAGPDAASGGGAAGTQRYGGAILGGTFYNGTQFPADYWDNYFFGDFNSGNLFRTVLDEQNNVTLVDFFGEGLGNYIDIDTGPDGALYYVNFGGTLYRLTHEVTEQNIVLSHRNVNTFEGNLAAFTLSLAEAPAGPVTVTVTNVFGDEDIQVVYGEALTFTPEDWFIPQPVYLEAAEDADADYDLAFLEVSLEGQPYQYVTVFANDNDQ